jgi:hypothetical protein
LAVFVKKVMFLWRLPSSNGRDAPNVRVKSSFGFLGKGQDAEASARKEHLGRSKKIPPLAKRGMDRRFGPFVSEVLFPSAIE